MSKGRMERPVYLGVWESVFKERWQPRQKSEEGARCAKVCNDHSTGQGMKRERERETDKISVLKLYLYILINKRFAQCCEERQCPISLSTIS